VVIQDPATQKGPADVQVSDLSLLYVFEGVATASVSAWAVAAGQADDPELRKRLLDMVAPSLQVQAKARTLIRKLGGNI